jgi:hypothetical protein
MPRQRGDALGQSAGAPRERRVVEIPNRHLIVRAHREPPSVGAESERGDWRRPRITFGRRTQHRAAGQLGQWTIRRAAIVPRAPCDPALDQGDLVLRQRVGLLRHPVRRVRLDQ